MRKIESMTIISQKLIAKNIYELVLSGNLVKGMLQAGQFVNIKVNETVNAILGSLYWIIILILFTIANATPTISATINSFHITLKTSFVDISSTANPLIVKVELCEPLFPPVPIIIGINETSIGIVANAFS